MSEKMDGVRAYWNGRELVSKSGKTFGSSRFTEWFVSNLPSGIQLDGELWMSRESTHVNVTSILNSKNSDWNRIEYYIFDIPSQHGTYEERMKVMESIKESLPPFVHVVENIQCTGVEHLQEYLLSIVTNGGEGVMLRKPNIQFTDGYTNSLLKVKVRELTMFSSFIPRNLKMLR
jgi:DNA ligase-1